jgi:putative transposase
MFKWPHAPSHLVKGAGTYIVTGSTYQKELLFLGKEKLDVLTNSLLEIAAEFEWEMQAWAVFPNHYHFIAHCSEREAHPKPVVSKLHSVTARELNKMDDVLGRRVWYQYRDTRITFERSYFARLHYVHQNPVKHGLAKVAENYPWCSAGWFKRTADLPFIETVQSFPLDNLNIEDEF